MCLSTWGPPNDPRFKMQVQVEDRIFTAIGKSKKEAKCKAAEVALKSLDLKKSTTPCNFVKFNEPKTTIEVIENPIGVEKNPISELNELMTGQVNYTCLSAYGPPHNPTFEVRVQIDGQGFKGTGKNKKEAKYKAAEVALQHISQKFSSQKTLEKAPSNFLNYLMKTDVQNDTNGFERDQVVNLDITTRIQNHISKNGVLDKGPVALLNELVPEVVYSYVENSNSPYYRFKAVAVIGRDEFVGTGPNKKHAQMIAAASALAKYKLDAGASHLTPDQIEGQQMADHIAR